MAPAATLKPFQLLEINIISAQDLEPVSKKMKTYARAWVNPRRKLSSCVDADGNNNPTWNDKFVFRVDDDFLREDTSAVMIEIYATHWLRDLIVGTVRVLVGNLIPPPVLSRRNNQHIGMRFIALQVRRPSGRPQGILNIGVALLDGSMRSMPLYTQLAASAVGYRDLMQDPPNLQKNAAKKNNHNSNNNNNNQAAPNVKPILRRTRSERSERVTFDNYSPNSSIIAVPTGKNMKESSILSISESLDPFKGMKKGKASSVISGAELREPKQKGGKKGKPSSVVSDSVYSKVSSRFYKKESPKLKNDEVRNKNSENGKAGFDGLSEIPTNKVVDEKSITKVNQVPRENKALIPATEKPGLKYNVYEYGGPKGPKNNVIGGPFKGNSVWSDSEVGPSPSEVAAAMAERRYPLSDNQSSVLDGWSVDESVEGLRSKLERWRMELPPLYDNGFSSSSYRSSGHRGRKRSESGSGLFSCFGNICGYECQCVCGKPPERRYRSSRFMSSSAGTPAGRSFI